MELPENTFAEIVRNTPLVSIDLLIERDGRYLVGLRTNRPAKDQLFVPGGRILKDETIADAFERITLKELGMSRKLEEASFVVVAEHHYPDSMYDENVSTHYVVLTYKIVFNETDTLKHDSQHRSFSWLTPGEIRTHPQMHPNTVEHFSRSLEPIPLLDYYKTVIDQLKFYNNVVWAFPPAYLAVIFFSIDKAGDRVPVLCALAMIALSLLYVFTRHVINQKSLIALTQTIESKISASHGSEFVPIFKSPKIFKATTVVQVVLYIGTIALFSFLIASPKIEKDGADRPATAAESKSESGEKPKSESEARPQLRAAGLGR